MSGEDKANGETAKQRALARAKVVGPVIAVMMIGGAISLSVLEPKPEVKPEQPLAPATAYEELPQLEELADAEETNSLDAIAAPAPTRLRTGLGAGCEQLAFQLQEGSITTAVYCTIRNQDYASCGDLNEIAAHLGRFLPSPEFQGQCRFDPRS